MDMLSPFQRDFDAQLKRTIQAAYPDEEGPTPAALLLERLLTQAEATPQLPPLTIIEMPGFNPDRPLMERKTEETRPVRWWERLLGFNKKPDLSSRHLRQRSREIHWKLYHEYLELHLSHLNAGSGLTPL